MLPIWVHLNKFWYQQMTLVFKLNEKVYTRNCSFDISVASYN